MEKISDLNYLDSKLFNTVGKNTSQMEAISRPNLTYWKDAWRRIKQNKAAFFGLIIIAIYVFLAVFGPMMNNYDYTAVNSSKMNQFISSDHWFGTDELGRDLWTRVWRGARVSLTIGFLSTILKSVPKTAAPVPAIVAGVKVYCATALYLRVNDELKETGRANKLVCVLLTVTCVLLYGT